MANILKAGGIMIRNRKLLVTRSKNKGYFIAPGGKLEAGETPEQALVRELGEELLITVKAGDLRGFGKFTAPAAGNPDKIVEMNVYLVLKWEGEPRANHEIEQLKWINSQLSGRLQIGSIFEHDILPRLKTANLID